MGFAEKLKPKRNKLHHLVSIVVDIPTISIAVASASVLVASIYYSFQMRHQTKLRRTDIILRLNTQFTSEGFQKALWRVSDSEFKDFDDWMKRYRFPSQDDVVVSCQIVSSFFEELGVLLSERLLDINLARKLFTGDVDRFWEKYEPVVIGMRKKSGRPTLYEWFEYYYNEMRKREQRK